MSSDKMLKAALWYAKKGFSVIPIRAPHADQDGLDEHKKPPEGFSWKKYQTEKPLLENINEWFSDSSLRIAIITGKINNLTIIDCDTEEAINIVESNLPENFIVPISTSPRGGRHYYFQYVDLPSRNNILPKLDCKSEGGYILAPPSSGLNGKGYVWLPGLGLHEVQPALMPDSLYSLLHNNLNSYLNRGGVIGGGVEGTTNSNSSISPQETTITTRNHINFGQGSRDESLFHVANHLVKGKMPRQEIEQILYLIGTKVCNPPFPEKEIAIKIQSAFKRADTKNRNIADEVREWVLTTKGHFKTTESHAELQLTTKDEKKACMMAILRMVDEKLIEKYGNQRGIYRVIENKSDLIDWQTADTSTLDITMPLSMCRVVNFRPKTLNVIAGSQDAGKTSLMLNIAMLNARKHKIFYFSSEMDGSELRERIEKFKDVSIEHFKNITFIDRSSSFADVIQPDALNIIDYLEITDNFFRISEDFTNIRNKLNKGLAFIAIQKDSKSSLGRGSSFSLEKPRLYLVLDYDEIKRCNILKIIKAKFWADKNINPRNMEMRFKIVHGVNLIPHGSWMTPDEWKEIGL